MLGEEALMQEMEPWTVSLETTESPNWLTTTSAPRPWPQPTLALGQPWATPTAHMPWKLSRVLASELIRPSLYQVCIWRS